MDDSVIKEKDVHEKFNDVKKIRMYLAEYGVIQDLISDELKKTIEEKTKTVLR